MAGWRGSSAHAHVTPAAVLASAAPPNTAPALHGARETNGRRRLRALKLAAKLAAVVGLRLARAWVSAGVVKRGYETHSGRLQARC